MTDYYVDHTAGGTGDGLSPVNAFTTILSRSVAWADGDRVWVRRTHVESQSGAVRPLGGIGSQNRMFIIGYPAPGYPFYPSRPIDAYSAGWDADNSALATLSTFSHNVPTISTSNTALGGAIVINTGTIVANMCFNQLAAGGNYASPIYMPSHTYADNILLCRALGVYASYIDFTNMWGEFGKVTLAISGSTATNVMMFGGMIFNHLVFPPQNAGGYVFGMTAGNEYKVGLFENLSSSINYMMSAGPNANAWPMNASNTTGPYPVHIRRMVGVKPFGANGLTETNSTESVVGNYSIRIDDYFGEGPRVEGFGGLKHRIASSAEAMFNGNRCVYLWRPQPNSNNTARNTFMKVLQKVFNVTSGTAIAIAQPVYIDSLGIASLSNGMLKTSLLARGCGQLSIDSANMIAGSYTPWSGTFVAGGSAWLLVNTWTPTETGPVLFEASAPCITRSLSVSAAGSAWYMLYGEPYAL